MSNRHVVVVAGEASGDQHAAALVAQLRAMAPDLTFTGVGGRAMARAGVELVFRAEELAVVGFTGVLSQATRIIRALRGTRQHIASKRPELVILVDFPDFNFRIGPAAKAAGAKVLYYIAPQVWAWRQGRAKAMGRFVDELACVLPFEPQFFARLCPQLKVSFVGHPLLDAPPPKVSLPVEENHPVVALLPGSRHCELRHMLGPMVEAAGLMHAANPKLHFLLPLAPGITTEPYRHLLAQAPPTLHITPPVAQAVLARAQVAIVASGTATVQAAIAGVPTVVVYKTGWLNYQLARRLVKVPFIAMPNLIAGRRVLPELIQHELTPQRLAAEAMRLLEDEEERRRMQQGLAEVVAALGGPGASKRAAEVALRLMEET